MKKWYRGVFDHGDSNGDETKICVYICAFLIIQLLIKKLILKKYFKIIKHALYVWALTIYCIKRNVIKYIDNCSSYEDSKNVCF